MTKTLAAACAVLAGLLLVTIAEPSAQTPPVDKVRITGWALSMSNVAPGANQTIQIAIDKWSSAPQRERLIKTFLEKKQEGLLSALDREPELGRFNFPGYLGPDPNNTMRLGTSIRYAWSRPGVDGGRRIVIITPRVIGFREQVNRPRTLDYKFTLFEMHFNTAGQGEGKMAEAAQILFDEKTNTIELENYASEPVRLQQLKLEVIK